MDNNSQPETETYASFWNARDVARWLRQMEPIAAGCFIFGGDVCDWERYSCAMNLESFPLTHTEPMWEPEWVYKVEVGGREKLFVVIYRSGPQEASRVFGAENLGEVAQVIQRELLIEYVCNAPPRLVVNF